MAQLNIGHAVNEAVFEKLLDQRDGIVACDLNGTIHVVNEACKKRHGVTEAPVSVESFRWQDLNGNRLPQEEVPLYRALRGEIITTEAIRIENQNAAFVASASPLYFQNELAGAIQVTHEVPLVPTIIRPETNDAPVPLVSWNWYTTEGRTIPAHSFPHIKNIVHMTPALRHGEEMVFLRMPTGISFRFKLSGKHGLLIGMRGAQRGTPDALAVDRASTDRAFVRSAMANIDVDILDEEYGECDFHAVLEGENIHILDIYDELKQRFLCHEEVMFATKTLELRAPDLFVRAKYRSGCLDFCDGAFIAKPVTERTHQKYGRVVMTGEPQQWRRKQVG